MTVQSSNVFIYSGIGANPECVKHTENFLKSYCLKNEIIPVDASYLSREKTPPAAYVFPGGRARLIETNIPSELATKITQYVLNGETGFLGICAGGMIATNWQYQIPVMNFANSTVSVEPAQRYLQLSTIVAKGPVFAKTKDMNMLSQDRTPPRTVPICWNTTSFYGYWNEGPYFYIPSVENSDKIIALYETTSGMNPLYVGEEKPAVVCDGRIALLGFHPESVLWARENGYRITDKDVEMNQKILTYCCNRIGLETQSISQFN